MNADDVLLGRPTPTPDRYDPDILRPIARRRLSEGACDGEDVWRLWELGWLDARRRPRGGLGLLRVPAHSPNIVESKSLKLYLASLAGLEFADADALRDLALKDLRAALGAAPTLEIHPPDSPQWTPGGWDGVCVDEMASFEEGDVCDAGHLRLQSADDAAAWQRFYTHLFRSRCPITGQPDHASVRVICDAGAEALAPPSLARYLLGFREHRAYHEECAERIFADLRRLLPRRALFVEMAFLRRGGLDINPRRFSVAPRCRPPPVVRLPRQ